jgi:hypothetical protein
MGAGRHRRSAPESNKHFRARGVRNPVGAELQAYLDEVRREVMVARRIR